MIRIIVGIGQDHDVVVSCIRVDRVLLSADIIGRIIDAKDVV